jgi:hypothetical protein
MLRLATGLDEDSLSMSKSSLEMLLLASGLDFIPDLDESTRPAPSSLSSSSLPSIMLLFLLLSSVLAVSAASGAPNISEVMDSVSSAPSEISLVSLDVRSVASFFNLLMDAWKMSSSMFLSSLEKAR